MHGAFDLRLALLGIEGPPDVMGGDHLVDFAGFVQDHHLGGPAEGGMGLDLAVLGLAGRGGVVDLGLAFIDPSDQVGQSMAGIQIGLQLGCHVDGGPTRQQGPRDPVVMPEPTSKRLLTWGRNNLAGKPVISTTHWIRMVSKP